MPAWKSDDFSHVYMYGCLVNGVRMYGLAVVLAFWSTTGISLTVDTHLCMAILLFYVYAMHLTAQFNRFNDGQTLGWHTM